MVGEEEAHCQVRMGDHLPQLQKELSLRRELKFPAGVILMKGSTRNEHRTLGVGSGPAGEVRVNAGDWLITQPGLPPLVCPPEVFAREYEPVKET